MLDNYSIQRDQIFYCQILQGSASNEADGVLKHSFERSSSANLKNSLGLLAVAYHRLLLCFGLRIERPNENRR